MRKVIFIRAQESGIASKAETNPMDGLTVLRGAPQFDKDLYLWEEYDVAPGKKEAFEAYCMGYLQFYEEHVRGGFKEYNIYFDWDEDGRHVRVYLDPPPKKKPRPNFKDVPEKVFGQTTGKGAISGATQNSPAPPPASTATVSDPPPPKQPPPPPL